MLYFYYGNDIDKARIKANELIDSLRKKKPDASFFSINSDNFNINLIQEYIGSQGLFSNKYIVYLDRICEQKEIKEEFLNLTKEISESENIFVLLEGKLDKATATKIEKKSSKFIKFDNEDSGRRPVYNAFALADAFYGRNKRDAWVLYRESINRGEAPEALHGMLFWKLKSCLIADNYRVWKREEIIASLERLIDIYAESRRGLGDLEIKLEAFILS